MNVKQYAFVTAYLKHRDPIVAYKLATGSQSTNLRSLQSAANRMLNKPGVREEIESVLKATRAEVEAEIAETTRTELLTIERKREILAQIINGQYTVMVRAKGKNCSPCTYFNSPTISQVLSGIREDNKMAGHYAVVTTRPNKKMQQSSTTSSQEKVPCPGDLGVILAFTPTEGRGPDPREMQESSTPPPGESPLHGDRGTLEPDNCETQQTTTTQPCPPQAGESRSDGGGTLAPEDEPQQITTTPQPKEASCSGRSPAFIPPAAGGGRGTHEQDNQKMQQSSTPESNPSTVEAPAKAVKLKKLLTETTSLANAPIPASLRPFFDAIEM